MTRSRIAIATASYRRELKAAISLAAAAGARGVSFDLRNELTVREFADTAIRQLLHQIEQHGMEAATAYFPLRLPLSEAAHADERITAITAAMQLSRRLRAGHLVIATGPLPTPQSSDDERLIEAVNAIASAGNQTGTVPCLSLGRPPISRVKQLIDEIKTGPVLIDIDPVDWLSDTSHATATGKLRLTELTFGGDDSATDESVTLDGAVRAFPQMIGHVQARDGRWSGRGQRVETPIGNGQVDWPYLLALLDEAAYSGWLTVGRENGDAVVDDIASGVAFLRQLQGR